MTSLKLDVDSRGLASAAAALERQGFETRAGATVAYALRRAGNLVRRNVRAEAKSHRRTGKLRDNIRTRAKGRGMDFEMKVYTGGSAAALVVVGAKAHPITPGAVMPLWDGFGKRAGITGFATAVQHPGFPGDPYFQRGREASESDIAAIFDASAATMVRELAFRMERRR